jgi:hypothetical protein
MTWHGFLPLVGHRREVIPEVGKELLAFEHEPLQIGQCDRSKTV